MVKSAAQTLYWINALLGCDTALKRNLILADKYNAFNVGLNVFIFHRRGETMTSIEDTDTIVMAQIK